MAESVWERKSVSHEKLVLGPDLDPLTRQAEDDAAVDDESRHTASTLLHFARMHPPAKRTQGARVVLYRMSVALVGAETLTRWFRC
jgi:hypothetical protein